MAQKKYELEILDPARYEILEIAKVHLELVGPASARRVTAQIKKSLENLRTHPHMGKALEDKELHRLGYRKLICGNYLCFYRVIGEAVFVYHVADGRTDYPKMLDQLKADEGLGVLLK